jgi:hypothetical protein
MRGSIIVPVLLGLALAAAPASADRYHRSGAFGVRPARPDPPGRIERFRPGNDGVGVRPRVRVAPVRTSGRSFDRAPLRSGPRALPGRVFVLKGSPSSRMSCNEAGVCWMSAAGAQTQIARAAASRAPGSDTMGHVNNARGKSFLGRAAPSGRMTCNEADACSMSKFSAQAEIYKRAQSRAPGSSRMVHLNNARGKWLLGRAAPSDRMACNEADACSMGSSGAKAAWQKAAAQRKP